MNSLFRVAGIAWSVAAATAAEPSIYLHETFEEQVIDRAPANPVLRRVEQVTVIHGEGRVGSGKVANYNDDTPSGGLLEYNVGMQGLGSLYVEFDLLNNRPDSKSGKSRITFSSGLWSTSSGMMLNANAKRAFGLEFYQGGTSKTLVLRVGSSAVQRATYELTAPQQVKVWVNDQDAATLSYARPDSGETVKLNPDSFVVWINDERVGDEPASGYPMLRTVTTGDAVIGRVGFCSTSADTAHFLIDNIHIEDPSGESVPVAPGQVLPSVIGEVTPTRLVGAETMAYREGTDAMHLFVFRPETWQATDRRPALMYFFGGGWTKGTPANSASWARWAAAQGMVGFAPDYRTKNRSGTSPLASVADGRAAFSWVVEHAEQLGIDPARVAVGGSSAGGHVALWTAIEGTPPGSAPGESPKIKPAALFLSSAVTDTSVDTGYTPGRFEAHALALSPVHQLDTAMPPVLMFHAEDDDLVDYRTAVALRDRLVSGGNPCELVTVPEGGHGFSTANPEWKIWMRVQVEQLLEREGLLPIPNR